MTVDATRTKCDTVQNAVDAPVARPVRPLLERLRDVERDGMTFAGEAANEIERLRAELERAYEARTC